MSKLALYGIGAAIVLAAAGGVYWKIYNDGRRAVIVEQERKLNTLKDKTHDVQTDALTDPKPRDGLRKYARPDE